MAIDGPKAEKAETPLSEIEEPVLAARRPMPRIKLKMPKKSDVESVGETDTAIAPLDVDEAVLLGEEQTGDTPAASEAFTVATNTRPRRTASQPKATTTARPIRSNARARAVTKPEPVAAPVTRASRSRRGDRTEEEIQRERERAEAIRAALESGDEDEEGIEESL